MHKSFSFFYELTKISEIACYEWSFPGVIGQDYCKCCEGTRWKNERRTSSLLSTFFFNVLIDISVYKRNRKQKKCKILNELYLIFISIFLKNEVFVDHFCCSLVYLNAACVKSAWLSVRFYTISVRPCYKTSTVYLA